jgi:hypothetical protein
MARTFVAAVALALLACSDEPVDITQLGDACGLGDRCPSGMTCLHYQGLGGELSSCEIPCTSDPDICPSGTICVTISDGPGPVCRAN